MGLTPYLYVFKKENFPLSLHKHTLNSILEMSYLKQHTPASLLKEGSSVQEKPLMKNISALLQLKASISSCYGPNGLSKLVLNALKKRIVTKNCSTIMSELEIDHPAVSLLKDASLQQLNETGDGSAAVILFTGELARRAEKMLREKGIPLSDILSGYRKALEIVENIVKYNTCDWNKNHTRSADDSISQEAYSSKGLLVCKLTDLLNRHNKDIILSLLRTSMESKLYSVMPAFEIQNLAEISYNACINVLNHQTDTIGSRALHFDVDHVRLLKLPGGNAGDTNLVKGFVLNQGVESGTEQCIYNAKVAVYNCAFDIMATETKGNILFENDEQMKNYAKNEEYKVESLVKMLKDKLRVNVVVSNTSFGEISLHFLRKYGMMAVKVSSKHDLRRLCTAIGARCAARISQNISLEDIGSCDVVEVLNEVSIEAIFTDKEQSSRLVPLASPLLVFRSDHTMKRDTPKNIGHDCKISTVLIRGSTQPMQEYMQQAFDNSINIFRLLVQQGDQATTSSLSKVIDRVEMSGFVVAGGGAFEAELSQLLHSWNLHEKTAQDGDRFESRYIQLSPIEKTVIEEYADALLILPEALAENSGGKSMETLVELQASHKLSSTGCHCGSSSSSYMSKADACRCGPKCNCSCRGSFSGIDARCARIANMVSSATCLSNAINRDVLEPLVVKVSALQLATMAIVDILSVDQMIMSKRAGGPKMQPGPYEDE